MKKKMQKYLSGSNEGFSLVELIIVIAIMAILVGVVALAVIPNLERSRESKDLTTLDNVASALATAVANAGGNAGSGSITDISALGSSGTTAVEKGIVESLGDCSGVKMVSSAAFNATDGDSTGKVQCSWDASSNKLKVWCGGSDAGATCKYQKDDSGNARHLVVQK